MRRSKWDLLKLLFVGDGTPSGRAAALIGVAGFILLLALAVCIAEASR